VHTLNLALKNISAAKTMKKKIVMIMKNIFGSHKLLTILPLLKTLLWGIL